MGNQWWKCECDNDDRFLNKSYCTWYAGYLLSNEMVYGMGQSEIAKELYAHAVCYYNYNPNGSFFQSNSIAKILHDKGSDGIDIIDGGDTAVRKTFYNLCWNMF